MKQEDFALGLLLEVVRQTALGLLAQRGAIEPYGVKLGADGDPIVFFPADQRPRAARDELLKALLDELGTPSSMPLQGVALVVALEADSGQRVFAAQIESASYRVGALFRYWQSPDGAFIVSEPELTGELMVRAGLDWPRPD